MNNSGVEVASSCQSILWAVYTWAVCIKASKIFKATMAWWDISEEI